MRRIALVALALALGAGSLAGAEEPTVLEWGRGLFAAHCASCHGDDATGSGPAGRSLKPRPADLTRISRRHGGEFPRMEIVEFIEGKRRVDAHESAMPRWGPILRRRPDGSISAGGSVPEIYAITDYLRSIQKAPRVDVRTIDLEPPSKPADPRALGDGGLR